MWKPLHLLVAIMVISAWTPQGHASLLDTLNLSGPVLAASRYLVAIEYFTESALAACLNKSPDCDLETLIKIGSLQVGIPFCDSLGPGTGLNGTITPKINTIQEYLGLQKSPIDTLGGAILCSQNCNGTCVPTNNSEVFSLYPMACKCSSIGCDAGGPVGARTSPTFQQLEPVNYYQVGLLNFWTRCDPEARCKCDNVDENDPTGENYNGYICNWVTYQKTLNYSDVIKFSAGVTYPSLYSPVRWCECCPKNSTGPPPPSNETTTVAPPTSNYTDCPLTDVPISEACEEAPEWTNNFCAFDCWCVHNAVSGTCAPSPNIPVGQLTCLCNYNGTRPAINDSPRITPLDNNLLCRLGRRAYFGPNGLGVCPLSELLQGDGLCPDDCECFHGARNGTCINRPLINPVPYNDDNKVACKCIY